MKGELIEKESPISKRSTSLIVQRVLHTFRDTSQNTELSEVGFIIAGGHHKKFGISEDGKCIIKITCQQEIEFYKKIYSDPNNPFRGIIPEFYGVEDNKISLQNLTYGMKNPQVIDIKLGTHSFTSPVKSGLKGQCEAFNRWVKKSYRNIRCGCRVSGWRVQGCSWIEKQNRKQIPKRSREYLRDLIERKHLSNEQLKAIAHQIGQIKYIIKGSNYGLIASSIIILVDGDSKPCVKLIDFAHAFELREGEKNRNHHYLGPIKGLDSLLKFFKNYI